MRWKPLFWQAVASILDTLEDLFPGLPSEQGRRLLAIHIDNDLLPINEALRCPFDYHDVIPAAPIVRVDDRSRWLSIVVVDNMSRDHRPCLYHQAGRVRAIIDLTVSLIRYFRRLC